MKTYCGVQNTYLEFLGPIESQLERRDTGFSCYRPFVGQDLPGGMEPVLVDDAGDWLAVRPDDLTYRLLFRPEMKPVMLEDIIMEVRHNPPPNIGELLGAARREWQAMQETTNRVLAALVRELRLLQERRKMPVFSLKIETDA